MGYVMNLNEANLVNRGRITSFVEKMTRNRLQEPLIAVDKGRFRAKNYSSPYYCLCLRPGCFGKRRSNRKPLFHTANGLPEAGRKSSLGVFQIGEIREIRNRSSPLRTATGKTVSAPIIEHYQKDRIVHPMAKIDPRLDPKLSRAATIADERAHAHSKSRCWRYVKEALVASGAVSSYPKTSLAKEAGDELVRDYGFKKLPIRDPYSAPVGSVLVYFKGRNRPGHVEIRTKNGFVSDFRSKDACKSLARWRLRQKVVG